MVDVTKMTRTVAALVLGCQALDPDDPARRRDPQPGRHRPPGGADSARRSRRPPGFRCSARCPGWAETIRCRAGISVWSPWPSTPTRAGDLERGRARSRSTSTSSGWSSWRERRRPAVELPLLSLDIEPGRCRRRLLRRPGVLLLLPREPRAPAPAGAELVAVAPECGRPSRSTSTGSTSAAVSPRSTPSGSRTTDELAAELAAAGRGRPAGLRRVRRSDVPGPRAAWSTASSYPMAGVLDLVVEQTGRPQGHGYEVATVDRDNPFFADRHRAWSATSSTTRGSSPARTPRRTVLTVERGSGVGDGRDGIVKGRVWASYLHLHALATPRWAEGFLGLAAQHAANVPGRPRHGPEGEGDGAPAVAGDSSRLERLVADEPRAVRHLLGRLWDPDETIRQRAARGARSGRRRPSRARARRCSGGWCGRSTTSRRPTASTAWPRSARSGRDAPDLIEPFVGPVACLRRGTTACGSEILRALARIAEAAPDLVGTAARRMPRAGSTRCDDDRAGG